MEPSKEESIATMKDLIKQCDEAMQKHGETGHVFMNRIKTYHPFTTEKRFVPIPAKGLKYRLEKEISRLEG